MSTIEIEPRIVFRTVIVALVAIAIGSVLVGAIEDVQQTIRWLAAAIFLALALAPAVALVERIAVRGHTPPRWMSIVAVFIAGFLLLAFLTLEVIPPLISEVEDLGTEAPAYVKDFEAWASDSAAFRELNQDFDLTKTLNEQASALPSKLGDAANELESISVGLLRNLVGVVTVLVLAFFLLLEGRELLSRMLGSLRSDHAERGQRLATRIFDIVRGYVSVNLLLALAAGLFTFAVLSLLGIKVAVPLAILVAFFDLVPLIGLSIGGLLVAIVIAFDDFPRDIIVWAVAFIVYQQIQDRVIQPMMYGRAVQISPLIAILALLAGAQILGILGALIAIPVAASIGAAWSELRGAFPGAADQPADGGSEPPRAGPAGNSEPASS